MKYPEKVSSDNVDQLIDTLFQVVANDLVAHTMYIITILIRRLLVIILRAISNNHHLPAVSVE